MVNASVKSGSIAVADARVSSLLLRPPRARAALLLAHGAGAGMTHPFMQTVADGLFTRGIATLRYQFPYLEQGRRRPDPAARLQATVLAALGAGGELGLPLFAGGKSMGGRMTSLAASQTELANVRGLVFLGFPLHPAGRPGTARGQHLSDVKPPMLFLQGARDRLADLSLLAPVCQSLGSRAHLHVIADADHSFHVPKRSGREDGEVLDELAEVAAGWMLARLD